MAQSTERIANLSRRRFLVGGALLAGGLVLAIRQLRGSGGSGDAASAVVGATTALDETSVGPWIRIGPDGQVTVWVEKAEMGQGIHSTLAALVAEELEVAWDQVGVEARPSTGPLRGEVTGASMSVQLEWEPMRTAGAAARAMLVAAAARAWSVPASECVAVGGRVTHPATQRSLGYGELAVRAGEMPVPASVELKSPATFRLLGKPLARLDLPDKVRGSAVFGIDVKVDGLLYAVPALGRVPGAGVASAAYPTVREMPGVRAIVEIPNGVAVVADRYWQARRAADALAPVFSGGTPAVDTPEYSRRLHEALATPGLVVGDTGDVASAFAGAAKVVEARYEVPWLAHATMEPMNCTASVVGSRCEIWATTQAQSQVRADVGAALGIDPETITVHPMLMGGAFGRRVETDVAVQAALASRAVARPVKLIWSREDDIRHDFYRPACAAELRAALDDGGKPAAFAFHVAGPWSDRTAPVWLQGAVGRAQKRLGSPLAPQRWVPPFVWWRLPALIRSGVDWIASGNFPPLNYTIPSQRLEYSLVESSLPVGWWRAVQASQNAFFLESFVDELAHAASVDPYAYRRALLSGRDLAVLDRAAEVAGWGRARDDGRALGIAQYAMAGTSVSLVAEVSVGADGLPRVHAIFCAIDCGRALNPDTIRAQVEGSILFGLTAALHGRITVEGGGVVQGNFHDYPLMRLAESPRIEVAILESEAPPSGVGEPATPPVAPAVANAVFAATRRRIRALPLL